jgi:hypothetical protein
LIELGENIAKVLQWKTVGYNEYRKKVKKKHSQELFCNYTWRLLTKNEATFKNVITELFWQTYTLKKFIEEFIILSIDERIKGEENA